jgi:hypothetical protein
MIAAALVDLTEAKVEEDLFVDVRIVASSVVDAGSTDVISSGMVDVDVMDSIL